VNRREFLVGAAALLGAGSLAACSSTSGSERAQTPVSTQSAAATRHAYGGDPAQFGDLYVPTGPRKQGVAVVIHGGFWRAGYDLSLGAPLAADLAARGYVAFNLEYRRIGNGGGWPTTLTDVSDGINLLASLDLDVSRVVAIGHSAGGQLAVWAAGRAALPAGAPGHGPTVTVTSVVSQAGVLDLATAQQQGVGATAEVDFLGGTPAQVPERYAIADPIAQVPLRAPVLCVHSRTDQAVPFAQSTAYVAAARAAGASAVLAEVHGDHFALIDPTSDAWGTVVRALPGLLAR
jgi:acetyl esterase/lipase